MVVAMLPSPELFLCLPILHINSLQNHIAQYYGLYYRWYACTTQASASNTGGKPLPLALGQHHGNTRQAHHGWSTARQWVHHLPVMWPFGWGRRDFWGGGGGAEEWDQQRLSLLDPYLHVRLCSLTQRPSLLGQINRPPCAFTMGKGDFQLNSEGRNRGFGVHKRKEEGGKVGRRLVGMKRKRFR